MGQEDGFLVAFADLDLTLDADELLGRALLLDPGGLDQEHEGSGAAVHDRHFGRAHIDVGIVDAETREGGHQVLHGRDLLTILRQGGAESGVGHIQRLGGNADLRLEVGAHEHNARVHRRGAKRQVDLLAGVQSHARGADDILEGTLSDHCAVARQSLVIKHRSL